MSLLRVRAVNTAPDSENRIHDDGVAAALGFRRGLVPGVTVYGYMTLAALDRFGEAWLERGAMSVRFKAPVYDGEDLKIEAQSGDGGRLDISLEGGRATGIAWMPEPDMPLQPDSLPRELAEYAELPKVPLEAPALGAVLGTFTKLLNLEEARISAPLPAAIGEDRAAHPAVLLNLSNELLMRNIRLGPWIHAASEVVNFSKAHDGETLTVSGRVVEKYARKGHDFVVLDVGVRAGERVVQTVRHTAIWRLAS